jgi:hypothetical protein
MTAVALGSPSPGGACLTRATIPAQCSSRLGELVVTVSQVPRWEEDHVVAVAKGHGLQAPKPDHHGQREWTFGSAIEKNGGKTMLARSVPYLPLQLSVFGPARVLSQRVNKCCVSLIWMVTQGEYTEVYLGSGKRRPYIQRRGGSIVFPCT